MTVELYPFLLCTPNVRRNSSINPSANGSTDLTSSHTLSPKMACQSLLLTITTPLCFTSTHLSTPSLPFPSLHFNACREKQSPLLLTLSKERGWSALRSSPTDVPPLDSSEKWILEPIGGGDSRRIGLKVPLPDTFEIAPDVVNIGRLPEKADIIIPVATVSGLHARLEKKDGNLLVTDMGSTNGTYIDERKLSPGVAATVSPGSSIAFGDNNLAIFRVSKVKVAEVRSSTAES